MLTNGRFYFIIFLLAVCAGIYFSKKEPVLSPAIPLSSTSKAEPYLETRSLRIIGHNGDPAIIFEKSGEGSPGLWLLDSKKRAMINLGVHGNGFPFVLVSDGAIRNFGLGRVDGKNASPILVFRSNDIVKMVFGLSMNEVGQPPFLAHYSNDDKKNVLFGSYCDAPSRACTQ